MKRMWQSGMFVLLFVAGPVAVGFADTLEEVEKKLTDAAKSVKSMKMKVSMEMEMANSDAAAVSRMTGTHWQKRDGDKLMMRTEGQTISVEKIGDTERESLQKTVMVNDGEFVYTLTDRDGETTAVKTKTAPEVSPIWKAGEADHDLKVLDEEKVDGSDCYVIEMTPKQNDAGDQSRTVYYCRKDCGVPAKTVIFGPDGHVKTVVLVTDIRINVDIPDDKFKFETPEDVPVKDLTGT